MSQRLKNMAPAYRDALRLVLLTGQRPGEVIGIRADEVDIVKAVWAHAGGARKEQTRPYGPAHRRSTNDRHTYEPQMRRALQALDAEVRHILTVECEADNVYAEEDSREWP